MLTQNLYNKHTQLSTTIKNNTNVTRTQVQELNWTRGRQYKCQQIGITKNACNKTYEKQNKIYQEIKEYSFVCGLT